MRLGTLGGSGVGGRSDIGRDWEEVVWEGGVTLGGSGAFGVVWEE